MFAQLNAPVLKVATEGRLPHVTVEKACCLHRHASGTIITLQSAQMRLDAHATHSNMGRRKRSNNQENGGDCRRSKEEEIVIVDVTRECGKVHIVTHPVFQLSSAFSSFTHD